MYIENGISKWNRKDYCGVSFVVGWVFSAWGGGGRVRRDRSNI